MPRNNEYQIGPFFETEPGKAVGAYLMSILSDGDPMSAAQYPHITKDYKENGRRIAAVIEGARHMVQPPLEPDAFLPSDVFVAIQSFSSLAKALELNTDARSALLPQRF